MKYPRWVKEELYQRYVRAKKMAEEAAYDILSRAAIIGMCDKKYGGGKKWVDDDDIAALRDYATKSKIKHSAFMAWVKWRG